MKLEKVTALFRMKSGSTSLWEDIFAYFSEGDGIYDNLNMDGSSLISVRLIIVGLFLGLCVASFAAVFNKRVLGDFVRKLLRDECTTPESAKTLPELGYADKLTIRDSLRRGVTLRRVVRCREEEEYLARMAEEEASYEERRCANPSLPKKVSPKSFRVDPDRHHFYIPEEIRYKADVKFEQRGTTWLAAAASAILILVAMIAVLAVLPKMLELLDELVGAFKSIGSDRVV